MQKYSAVKDREMACPALIPFYISHGKMAWAHRDKRYLGDIIISYVFNAQSVPVMCQVEQLLH